MAKRPRATRILSEEERQALLRRREKKKRFQKIDAPAPRGPKFIPLLMSILAIAVILYQLFGPDLDLGLDFLDVEDVESLAIDDEITETDSRLDPERFRDSITALEGRLFAPDLVDQDLAGYSEALAGDLDVLAIRFRAEGTDAFDAAAETLEASSSSLSTPVTMSRLETLRGEWAQLRGSLFLPVDWFHSASVEGGDEQEMLTLASYRQNAFDTLSLVEDALTEVELYLTEDLADDDALARRDTDWQAFVDRWRDQHAEVADRRLPRPDARATNDQLLAIQDFEQRLRGVSGLLPEPARPDDGLLSRLESAQTAWRQVVDRFDDLLDGPEAVDD
ncbi:MAG: hypothetical protein AAGE94_14755, partial [Acidobacteriota bacterium]